MPMTRWLLRRLVLSLITLWLLASIVFIIANVLPNDVGRTIAGPFAPQETVDAINERLGTNDPLPEQYIRRDAEPRHVRFRELVPEPPAGVARSSARSGDPRIRRVRPAADDPDRDHRRPLRGSPPDRPADRGIIARRRDAVIHPGIRRRDGPRGRRGRVQLGLLPVLATPPPRAGPVEVLRYLAMPALAMAIVYFGYIARMTRGHDGSPQIRLHPDGDDEGATTRRPCGATCCATRSCRRSP